jgi:hypothetical protein
MRTFDKDEKAAFIVRNNWHDWLFPHPVWAVGSSDLYLVHFEGGGFRLCIDGESPAIGFFASTIVRATSFRQAESRATQVILNQWRRRGYARSAGFPNLEVEEVQVLPDRFRLRSRFGFVLFRNDDGVA